MPGRQEPRSQFNERRIKCVPCDSSGENSWKLAPAFLWTSPHAPLSFVDVALGAFAEINFGPEYDYMLSIVTPPSKSPNVGEVWRILNTSIYAGQDT